MEVSAPATGISVSRAVPIEQAIRHGDSPKTVRS